MGTRGVHTHITIQTISGNLEAPHPVADPTEYLHETQPDMPTLLHPVDHNVFKPPDRPETVGELPLNDNGSSGNDSVCPRVDDDDGEIRARHGAHVVELQNPRLLARVGHG